MQCSTSAYGHSHIHSVVDYEGHARSLGYLQHPPGSGNVKEGQRRIKRSRGRLPGSIDISKLPALAMLQAIISLTFRCTHLAMSTNAEVVMFFSLSCTTVAPPATAAATT